MKKVLVVFLSAVMVLSLAAVAFGAVNVNGELKLKYNFQGTNSVVGATPKGQDKNDLAEIKLKFSGSVNDNLSYFVAAKAKASDNDDGGTPSKTDNTDFYLDEYYFAYATDFGTIKAGLTAFKPKGPIVDVIDGAYKDLKAATGIQYSNKFADAIDVAVFYTPDYYKCDESLYDNATALKVGYNTDMWGVEGNVVSIGNKQETAGKKVAEDGRATGYTVNAYVVPVENFTVYCSVGKDQFDDPAQVLGLKYVYDKLTLMGEYDFDKKNGDYVNDFKENLWGVKAIYQSAHGIEYEAGKKLKGNSTNGTDMASECWVSAKVKF
jgi:hypothetical protein